jgi:hypothetical protein
MLRCNIDAAAQYEQRGSAEPGPIPDRAPIASEEDYAMSDIENTSTVQPANNVVSVEAAREFVKKAAESGKARATTLHANVEKATADVEKSLMSAVGDFAKLARNAQQAAFEDAEAFFANVDKIASAKTVAEAAQIYGDYLRDRSNVALTRARAASDYFGNLLAEGAKTARESVAKLGASEQAAA